MLRSCTQQKWAQRRPEGILEVFPGNWQVAQAETEAADTQTSTAASQPWRGTAYASVRGEQIHVGTPVWWNITHP